MTLDTNDFEPYFQTLKQCIQDISIDEVNSKFCNEKVPLELRFHQDFITYKQMERIEEGEKELLLEQKQDQEKLIVLVDYLLNIIKIWRIKCDDYYTSTNRNIITVYRRFIS